MTALTEDTVMARLMDRFDTVHPRAFPSDRTENKAIYRHTLQDLDACGLLVGPSRCRCSHGPGYHAPACYHIDCDCDRYWNDDWPPADVDPSKVAPWRTRSKP